MSKWALARRELLETIPAVTLGLRVSAAAREAIAATNKKRIRHRPIVSQHQQTKPLDSRFTQVAKLTTPNSGSAVFIGDSVALSGDGTTALIGVPDGLDDSYVGSAYLFERRGGTWSQQTELTPTDGNPDYFGNSVALSGDGTTALIGAVFDNSAYVFKRSGDTWSQQSKLTPTNTAQTDPEGFGTSIALSSDGTTALVGAYSYTYNKVDGPGQAYVFKRSGDAWSQHDILTATDGDSEDAFGFYVTLSGDGNTALVGAASDEDPNGEDAGSAYVFEESGDAWSQQVKLAPTDGDSDDVFGNSAALSRAGTTAIIGAKRDENPNGKGAGSAYIFEQSGSTWSEQTKLTPTDGSINDYFGESVALSGDSTTALVGAYYDDPNGAQSGSAYVFDRSGNTWSQRAKLTPTDGDTADIFGKTVALSGDGTKALIEAPVEREFLENRRQTDGYNGNSAYVFGSGSSESPNTLPTASFTVTPSSPATGESFTLDASGSSDSDGSIQTYEWDLDGDGNYEQTGQTVTYTFSSAGTQSVTLRVTDDDNESVSTSKPIEVTPQENRVEPEAFYNFEGTDTTVVDRTGNDHTGELIRATRVSDRGGKVAEFDRTNQEYAELGTTDSLEPRNGSYSVSFWFKTSTSEGADHDGRVDIRTLFSKRGSTNERFVLKLVDETPGANVQTDNALVFQIKDDTGLGNDSVTSNQSYADGEWHQVLAVRDVNEGEIRLYVDGELKGSATDNQNDVSPNGPVYLAGQPEYPEPDYYTGRIDNIKIWKKAVTAPDTGFDPTEDGFGFRNWGESGGFVPPHNHQTIAEETFKTQFDQEWLPEIRQASTVPLPSAIVTRLGDALYDTLRNDPRSLYSDGHCYGMCLVAQEYFENGLPKSLPDEATTASDIQEPTGSYSDVGNDIDQKHRNQLLGSDSFFKVKQQNKISPPSTQSEGPIDAEAQVRAIQSAIEQNGTAMVGIGSSPSKIQDSKVQDEYLHQVLAYDVTVNGSSIDNADEAVLKIYDPNFRAQSDDYQSGTLSLTVDISQPTIHPIKNNNGGGYFGYSGVYNRFVKIGSDRSEFVGSVSFGGLIVSDFILDYVSNIIISANSPVRIDVTDPNGNQLPHPDEPVEGTPPSEIVYQTDPSPGDYEIQVEGTGTGEYSIDIQGGTPDGGTVVDRVSGDITSGETQTLSAALPSGSGAGSGGLWFDAYVNQSDVVDTSGLNTAISDYLSGNLSDSRLNSVISSYLGGSPIQG